MSTKKFEDRLEKLLRAEISRLEETKAGSATVTHLPNHIYVEPTNRCNLNCATCTPHTLKKPYGNLSLDVWKNIIDYFIGIDHHPAFTLIGRGEPLMHKQIDEIVAYASTHGFPTYIISNGTLLKEEMAHKLIKAGLKRIQFSIHAVTPETYKTMTNRDLYHAAIGRIERFIEINNAAGRPIHVSVFSCVSSINEHEMDEFKKNWEGRVDRVHTHHAFTLHGDSKMAEDIAKNRHKISKPGAELKGCSIPWWFFTIRWDGAIVPCALDHAGKIVIQNIYNEDGGIDLEKAWNSEIYRELRRAEQEQDWNALMELGYDCENCEARLDPNAFNEKTKYIEGFPRHFALQFSPVAKSLFKEEDGDGSTSA